MLYDNLAAECMVEKVDAQCARLYWIVSSERFKVQCRIDDGSRAISGPAPRHLLA